MPGLWRSLALALLVGALGFFAGRATAPQPRNDEVLRALEEQSRLLDTRFQHVLAAFHTARCASTAQPVDAAALRTELLQALREELRATPGPPAPQPAKEPAREQPSPEAVAALQSVDRLLEGALQQREWGEAQARDFRLLLAQLPESQRAEAARRLAAALNRGDIKLTTAGPPF